MTFSRSRAVACALVISAAVPAVALADGAGSIAKAPTVVDNQLESGNTANVGSASANTLGCHSWWKLHVVRGDHLQIDFNGAPSMLEELYPIGTNDSNFTSVNPLPDSRGSEQSDADSSGGGQANYIAPRDGTMPMSFAAPSCGVVSSDVAPYTFKVIDQHSLILAAALRTDPDTHTSQLFLSAHMDDGQPVPARALKVQLERHAAKRWVVTKTDPSAPARFTIDWQQQQWGTTAHIRMVVSGPGYWTTAKYVTVNIPGTTG